MSEEKPVSKFKVNVNGSARYTVSWKTFKVAGIIIGITLAVKFIAMPVGLEMEYKRNEKELELLTKGTKSEEDTTYL